MTTSPRFGNIPNLSPVWSEVMTRAGRRCEATRRPAPGRPARCEHAEPGAELVVAPRDPAVPEHAAWRVPVAELAAWCVPCLADARRRVAGRRARLRVIPGQLDLIAEIVQVATETGSVLSAVSGRTVTSDSEGVGTQSE